MFRCIARLIAFALLAGATLSLSACNSGGSGAGSGGSGSLPGAATMRVHYFRADANYTNWGVYSWLGPKTPSTGWPGNRFLFTTTDSDGWGKHADIAMDTTQTTMAFLITLPNALNTDAAKDCASDQHATLTSALASTGQEIWVVSGDCTVYTQEPGKLRLSSARAVWVTSDTLIWPGASASNTYQLLAAANGGITASTNGTVSGGTAYALTVGTTTDFAALPAAVQAKYPGATVLKVATPFAPSLLSSLLNGEVAIVQNANGAAVDGTQVQLAPVLDSLFAANAQSAVLGLSFVANVPTFKVWAPTAKSVSLNIYSSATAGTPSSTVMTFDPASGIWSYTAPDVTWTNLKYYYTYSVNVYSRPANNTVVTNTVVDPYATSLNALDTSSGTSVSTSLRSMVLNLADTANMPTGWGTALPVSLDGTDSALYELHVRDFSANDASVATINLGKEVGKFEAFAPANAGVTNGMIHLAALATAGLTHVHLLPAAEFASVDEVHCTTPSIAASTGAALAAEMAVLTTQNSDCFNWGYDPIVYGVPEGSYSTNATDGSKRVLEFRDMVMGLHSIGLRVVMDVVYNHTPASGQGDVSILDKIVPGYYYRLDASGNVTGQSGAGSDIAAENAMTEKLVIDTLTRWADQYKVDGFRFDIMSLLPKQVLVDAQSAVNAVAVADGRSTGAPGSPGIYLYGEGWSQSGLSFTNAQQSNMAGTGIGTFNDRLRDAVRGGGPFDNGASMVSNQGFVNGLCYDNNDGTACNTTTSGASLNVLQNRISVGLAGNLATFPLNSTTTGAQVDYFGSPTGYTTAPQENIVYISVHDNETVFDVSQYKHPVATSAADRARAQVVGLSLVALAQGVPFFHAGDDMLRSKSMDSNSYNSGDYFNSIDWSGLKNNWAVGAPPQNTGNNANNLATIQGLFTNGLAGTSSITPAVINNTTLAFQDFLRLRKDTTMFRLKTATAINGCVSFPDQGAQKPGLIVMSISGTSTLDATVCGDTKYKSIVVLFNANKITQTFTVPGYIGKTTVVLHPLQAAGNDTVVKGASFAAGVFSVPARTTAVFVEN
ncbi:MAG TPA: alpha-1,6-glucosidase domain-containing protein [Gallionella sp.]